jgi:hypothetical protein
MIDGERRVVFEGTPQQAMDFIRANRFNVLFTGMDREGGKVTAWPTSPDKPCIPLRAKLSPDNS